ncbi:terminase small subunit [Bacillus haynesii]|uniref:terminase small subunit n=1 Tax=Bacillus haynesii TaxID=1925021 RepID=UPI0022826A6A|nr:terminase small subunit [Bacillus haynesii]MCY8408976.1 terminase small subunit [Bacillus haynesii]MCY8433475.1 terminase small subunit [Bacillus haynesii]MCY8557845.1 terminase small subunit [Bacillus haynesii]
MDWEKIKKEYETTDLTLKALAEKHDVKIGTLKSRKSREGWARGPTEKDATRVKEVATPQPIIESDELNDKQKMFCLYYIKYFNATKAYQKAYGCDYFSAKAHGYKLLQKVAVKKEIDALKAQQQQSVFIDAQAVLQKYIDIAFADITDFVEFGTKESPATNENGPLEDEDGNTVMFETNYVTFKESTEVDGTIITEVKKGKDGVSVKLADKMKALEFLAKYTDLLSENDRKKLQLEKLKAETAKLEAETKQDQGDGGKVVIVNDKEAMRKAMEDDDQDN